MLPRNHWYAVLEATEVKTLDVVAARRMGLDLVFWRDDEGTVAAALDRCPHRKVQLSRGRVEGGELVCPFHTFRFTRDGRSIGLPGMEEEAKALRLETFPVRDRGGWLWLWWGDPAESLPEVPHFPEIESLPSTWVRQDWLTSWERVVECGLDTLHLPAVHRTTIGRTASGVPEAKVEAGLNRLRIDVRGLNQRERPVVIDYRYPNAWIDVVGPDTVLAFAVAPVERDRSTVYLRAHQRLLGLPAIGGLANRFLVSIGLQLLDEDRVLVESQPAEVEPGEGPLIGVDAAVAAFRQMHAEAAGAPDAGAPNEPDRNN
jgi:phenylpropionate dioxygenase-like ring-hydroxylating dioxygenase large terminal subunit